VAVNKALASKEFQDKLLAIGLTPTPRSQIEFARWVAEENEKWQRVVKESGATID
jgi:tripartite-type tricarboxylate transporter receptor subunit TctC